MRVSILPAKDITPGLVDLWVEGQQANPALRSPFFRPEFTQAVAATGVPTSVGVIDDGAAFFPFHREMLGIGRPVGARLSDYHGVIAQPEFEFDAAQLVRAAGLRLWDFDHVPAAQTAFLPAAKGHADSPQIDLDLPDAGGSAKLREQASNRRRKLAREVGPVELEFHCTDAQMLQQCWNWKGAQYERSGFENIFSVPWMCAALSTIAASATPNFSGSLSVLRAGGRPVAMHFGMRSGNLLHYWLPSYDPELAVYSPGTLLLLAIMDAAPQNGVSVIDLGKGDAFYKSRLCNASTPLIEGTVTSGPLSPLLKQSRDTVRRWVRASPLRRPAEILIRRLRGR